MLSNKNLLRRLPDLYSFVGTGGGDTRTIGRPGQGVDDAQVIAISVERIAAGGGPDVNGATSTSRDYAGTTGSPGERIDNVAMGAVGQNVFPGESSPYLDGFV